MVLHHLSVSLKWLVDDGAINLTEELSERKFGEKIRKPCFGSENKVALRCKASACLSTESESRTKGLGFGRHNQQGRRNFNQWREYSEWEANWVNGVTLDKPNFKRWEEQRGYPPTKDLWKNYKDEDGRGCGWHMEAEYWRCYTIRITCSRGTVT